MKMATIITAGRPPFTERKAKIQEDLRNAFGSEAAAKLMANIAPTPLIEISATDIRRRRKEGNPIAFLTPCAAISYMDAHGLYLPREPVES